MNPNGGYQEPSTSIKIDPERSYEAGFSAITRLGDRDPESRYGPG